MQASGAEPIVIISDRIGLGDGIRLLPLISYVRQQYPDRPIWWMVSGPSYALRGVLPLLEGKIDRLFEIPQALWWPWSAIRALVRFPRFHRVFDARTRIGDVLLAAIFLRRDKMLSCLPFYSLSGRRRPRSIAERHWSMVEDDAGRSVDWYDAVSAELSLPSKATEFARSSFPPGRTYAGVVVSTIAQQGRAWIIERYFTLGRALLERGLTPVFFAGPTEVRNLPALRERVPGAIISPLRYPGEADEVNRIELAAAAMKHMTFAISPDTGPGHLFGILGVSLISLFGPTDPERAAAYARKLIPLRAKDADGKWSMEGVTVPMVLGAVDELLGSLDQATRPTGAVRETAAERVSYPPSTPR